MFHICRTIRRHFCLRRVVHWSAEIQTNVYDPRSEGSTDQASEFALAHVTPILQNSRKHGTFHVY